MKRIIVTLDKTTLEIPQGSRLRVVSTMPTQQFFDETLRRMLAGAEMSFVTSPLPPGVKLVSRIPTSLCFVLQDPPLKRTVYGFDDEQATLKFPSVVYVVRLGQSIRNSCGWILLSLNVYSTDRDISSLDDEHIWCLGRVMGNEGDTSICLGHLPDFTRHTISGMVAGIIEQFWKVRGPEYWHGRREWLELSSRDNRPLDPEVAKSIGLIPSSYPATSLRSILQALKVQESPSATQDDTFQTAIDAMYRHGTWRWR